MGAFLSFLPLEKVLNKPKTFAQTKDRLYREYNQWGTGDMEEQWFVRFLRHHFPDNKTVVNFFGPLRTPFLIRNKFEGIKVFYSPEDIDHPGTKLHLYFGDYCLDYVDLAMGYARKQHEKYLHFPFWLTTHFNPEADETQIRERIREINTANYEKNNECVLINRHDPEGVREFVYNGVKDILDVKLAGPWKNNTRDLWDKYNNDKELYMRTFKFNICAENDNTKDYVTEKIFDAFLAGCVPLYYGSDNNPEPGLINPDVVIFWNKDGNNEENRKQVLRLKNDDRYFAEFMARPRLLPAMEDYVIERYVKLKEHFTRLLKN